MIVILFYISQEIQGNPTSLTSYNFEIPNIQELTTQYENLNKDLDLLFKKSSDKYSYYMWKIDDKTENEETKIMDEYEKIL